MELNTTSSIRQILEAMSAEQLEQMLNAELEKNPVDEHSVRMILQILQERHKDNPVDISSEMRETGTAYLQKLENMKKTNRRSNGGLQLVLRIGSVAAVLALVLLTMVPQRAEAGSLWDRLARWTADIVEFFSPGDNCARLGEYTFTTDNSGLQQVYNAVVEIGITEPVVPMWLPGEPELVELTTDVMPARTQVHARFANDETEIIYLAQLYLDDVSHKYHGDGEKTEIYTIDETNYTVMRNNDNWVAFWSVDNVECSIVVDCQEEALLRALRSIYEMEDE